jgi:hypothetical protein
VVDIPVAVMTLLDHDGIVAIPVVALPDNFTVAIPITITIVAGSDRDAARTHTNSNLFRTSRHSTAYPGHCDGYYCKTPDHRMLLKFVNYRTAIPAGLNGSGKG